MPGNAKIATALAASAAKQIHLIVAERGYMDEPDGDVLYEHKVFGSYPEVGKWIEGMGEDTWSLRVVYLEEDRIASAALEAVWED